MGVVSIVEVPGVQLAGGTGLIRHPQLFRGLYMGPNLIGISTMVYIADLQAARRKGFGNDVQAYRASLVDKYYAFVTTGLSYMTLSPGGGGPGQSLTSTATPPSVEEVGRMITTPPSVEEVGRMVTSGGRSRKSCPSGYRWNGRRCVRKD